MEKPNQFFKKFSLLFNNLYDFYKRDLDSNYFSR